MQTRIIRLRRESRGQSKSSKSAPKNAANILKYGITVMPIDNKKLNYCIPFYLMILPSKIGGLALHRLYLSTIQFFILSCQADQRIIRLTEDTPGSYAVCTYTYSTVGPSVAVCHTTALLLHVFRRIRRTFEPSRTASEMTQSANDTDLNAYDTHVCTHCRVHCS